MDFLCDFHRNILRNQSPNLRRSPHLGLRGKKGKMSGIRSAFQNVYTGILFLFNQISFIFPFCSQIPETRSHPLVIMQASYGHFWDSFRAIDVTGLLSSVSFKEISNNCISTTCCCSNSSEQFMKGTICKKD